MKTPAIRLGMVFVVGAALGLLVTRTGWSSSLLKDKAKHQALPYVDGRIVITLDMPAGWSFDDAHADQSLCIFSYIDGTVPHVATWDYLKRCRHGSNKGRITLVFKAAIPRKDGKIIKDATILGTGLVTVTMPTTNPAGHSDTTISEPITVEPVTEDPCT